MAIFNMFTKVAEATSITGFATRNADVSRKPTYVTESIDMNDQESATFDFEDIPVSTTTGEIWISFYIKAEVAGNEGVLRLYDVDFDETNAVIEIFGANGLRGAGVRIWDGASQAVIVADSGENIDELIKWDVQFIRDDSAGEVRVYRNNALVGEATAIDTNRSAWTNINRFTIRNNGNTTGGDIMFASAFILADEDTRDIIFAEETFTGVGAVDTMSTGGFAEVTETVTDNLPSTFATAQSIGLGLTLLGDISDDFDTGHEVLTVFTSMVVNKTGTAVDEIAAVARIGGVNYPTVEKPITSNSPGVETIQFQQAVNPDTGLVWTVAEVEASEGGFLTS